VGELTHVIPEGAQRLAGTSMSAIEPGPGSVPRPVGDDNANGVRIFTFGCRLNAAESDQIRAQALADGVANATVFNTCAVTGEAVRQAKQAIRKAARERPDAKLIVTGCAAQIDPTGFAQLPGVGLVLGNAEKTAPGALSKSGVQVGDILAPARPLASPLPASGERATPGLAMRMEAGALDASVALSPTAESGRGEVRGPRARAYLEIQNGCDHRCTFCVIPFGRGNSRSVPARRVVDEIRGLAQAGAAEVVLTGVDLTNWGADLAGAPALGDLVRRVLTEVPELPRLRLSSLDAAEFDAELMACFATEPRLAPHLHLSLQSGDDLILKRMKRRHSSGDALALIEAVRAARPDTAFGADMIAGFPTESDSAFENTLAFVERAGLAYLHVFPFSPRPGTPAARMPQVAREVVKTRAARLREAGAAALARHLDRQVGRRVEGLVECAGRARAANYTEIACDGARPIGQLAWFEIVGHDGRRVLARAA
jgi:threonylcarbamoyladenosine tRNA methylthiotransferase MtaB